MVLKDCVLVLGSGKSILNLTKTERELLNSCEVKIGINKYAAFYELTGIEPTHVYFHDDYDESSVRMLNYIFKLFRKNKLKRKVFILSENYKEFVFDNYIKFMFYKQLNIIKKKILIFFVKLGRLILKRFSVKSFNDFNFFLNKHFRVYSTERYVFLTKKSIVQYITIQDSISKGNKWVKSLQEPLYHFKGSFSTVLNYISICFPDKKIILAGVDFNSSDYFFEKELEQLNFDTKDWTYELRKINDKHYSIIETHGVKIDDELPFMIEELDKLGNKMYSLNKQSYLVEHNFVEYMKLENLVV